MELHHQAAPAVIVAVIVWSLLSTRCQAGRGRGGCTQPAPPLPRCARRMRPPGNGARGARQQPTGSRLLSQGDQLHPPPSRSLPHRHGRTLCQAGCQTRSASRNLKALPSLALNEGAGYAATCNRDQSTEILPSNILIGLSRAAAADAMGHEQSVSRPDLL
jgi:hypothetical protein